LLPALPKVLLEFNMVQTFAFLSVYSVGLTVHAPGLPHLPVAFIGDKGLPGHADPVLGKKFSSSGTSLFVVDLVAGYPHLFLACFQA
jgi:hypothetical protein